MNVFALPRIETEHDTCQNEEAKRLLFLEKPPILRLGMANASAASKKYADRVANLLKN